MTRDNERDDARRGGPTTDDAAERYPERRPARRIVIMLFVAAAICVVMIPVLLANNGRNLEILGDRLGLPLHEWWRGKTARVPRPPMPQTPASPTPTADLQPRRPKIPTPALPSPPSHLSAPSRAWQPETDCNALEPGATGEKPVFLTAPDGRSECTVLIALSDGDKTSSLFMQIRATGTGLSSLRMKLNFGEDGQGDALAKKAGDLAQRILTPVSDDDRGYLQAKMEGRQAFRTEIGDYRMTFRMEGIDTSRFNFIAVSKVKEPAETAQGQPDPGGEVESPQP